MGILGQLRLTLWKHVTIRKRQPITLLLEFLWPIVVFLIIASVRHMFPPQSKGDCAYRARALPSAGLLPFMQSFVCNLDNQCYNLSSYEEIPSYKNAKMGPLVEKFYPLVQRPDLQNVLNGLPTTMKLASHAVRAMDRPPVRKVLGERILVRDLLKEPETMQKYLVEEVKLDAVAIRGLLEAAIDIGQLLRALPSFGISQLMCKPKVLGTVLQFSDGVSVDSVAATLCPLVVGPIPPGLVQKLMMQVDVRGLVGRGTLLLHHLGSEDVAAALDGIGDIVDALQDIPILATLAKAPLSGDTEQLADYMQHAIEFLNVLKGLNFDLDFLGEMMDDLERIVGPNEFIAQVKVIGKQIHRLISWSQHGVLEGPATPGPMVADVLADPEDFSRRLRAKTNLSEDNIRTMLSIRLKPGVAKRDEVCYKLCEEMTAEDVVEFQGTIDTSTLFQLWMMVCSPGNCQKILKEEFPGTDVVSSGPMVLTTATIVKDLKDLLSGAAYLGNKLGDTAKKLFPLMDVGWKGISTTLSVMLLPKWSLENDKFFVGLASVLETLPGYLPEKMRSPVLNLLTAADVFVALAIAAAKRGSEAEQILYHKFNKDPKVITKMLSMGPSVVSSLADVIAMPDTLETLVERPQDVYSFLCNKSLVQKLLPEGSSSPQRTILQEFLCNLPVAEVVESFASLERQTDIVAKIEGMMLANGEVDEDTAFNKRIRSLCLQVWEIIQLVQDRFKRADNWGQFITHLDVTGQKFTAEPWRMAQSKLQISTYAFVLHVYSSSLGQSLEASKFAGRTHRLVTRLGVMMDVITTETFSVPREFLINLAKYWPSMVHMFLDGLADPARVRIVASTRPWSEIVCNETMLNSVLPVPQQLDDGEFADFFCNLTTYVEIDILKVNWFEKPFVKVIGGLNDGERASDEVKINWRVTWKHVEEVLRRYGRFAQESLKYSDEVQELMKKTKIVFENMNVTNILRFSISVVTTALEFADRQLETLQPWAWKNVKALVSVMDMIVQYMNKELEKIIAENKVETGVLSFNLPTLTKLMKKVIRLFPDFMNVWADLLTSRLGDFIGRIFRVVRTEGAAVCDGLSLTNLMDFGFTGDMLVRELERFACGQWKVVMAELIQYPMMFQMIWKFREANREGKDLIVDWTRTSEDLQRLMDNADNMTRFDGAIFPDVEGFTVENANAAIDRLVHAVMINTTARALKFALLISDALVPLFENVLQKNESVLINGTSMISLLHMLPDGNLGKEQRGQVAWLAFKTVAKTADIILADVTRFFHKFKDDNVTLSDIFGPITLTAMFEAFPDYVNTFIHSILRPNLSRILEEFRHNGTLSFEKACDRSDLLEQLVITPRHLQDVNRTTVLDTACRLLSEPFHYFALEPYIYSWAIKTLDKVIMLWTEQDPRHIIVHFVDIIDGIEFLANHAKDIVGNATDVAAYFRGLVSKDRWQIVGNGLYETVVRAQLDSWDHFLQADLTSINRHSLESEDVLASSLLRIATSVINVVGTGLVRADNAGHQTFLSQLLMKFQETRKLVHFAETYSIDIFKMVWYTASVDPLKLTTWLRSPNPWNDTCTSSPSSFLSIPPGSFGINGHLSLKNMKETFCDIDFEALVLESAETPVDHNLTTLGGDGYASLARSVVDLVQDLAKFRLEFPKTELRSVFLDMELWQNAVRELEPSPKQGSGIKETLGMLLDKVVKASGDPEGHWLQNLKSLEMTVEATLSNIGIMRLPLNESIWQTLRTWYQDKPQVLTFVNVLQNFPGLATSIVGTLMDPPKLRTLLQKLLTLTQGSTLAEFCQDLHLDDYFAIANNTSFADVQLLICATDWSRFAREINPFPLAVKNTRESEFGSVPLISKLGELLQNIIEVTDIGLPYLSANYSDLPWIGENVWAPILNAASQFRLKVKERGQLINMTLEYLSLLDLIPDWSDVKSFFQLINLQMNVVLKHLALTPGLAESKQQALYAVLTDVNLLTKVVHHIHDGVVEAASLSVDFAFLKQLKYFETFPNDTSYFCLSSPKTVDLSDLELNVKKWATLDQVFSLFCNEPSSQWIHSLHKLKIPDETVKFILENMMVVLPKESQWFDDPRWQRSISFDWTSFRESVHYLDRLCRNPPTDFYPGFTWSSWKPVFKAFGKVLPLMIAMSGETVCPTVPWINYEPFAKLIGLVEKQVLLADEYERLLCDFPRMNLSTIYHRLKKDLDLVETARQARIQFGRINLVPIHEPDGQSTSCPPVFNATSHLADSLYDLVVDYVENGTRIEKMKECFKDDNKAVVVEEIDKYIKLVSKAMPLLNLPNMTSLTNSTDFIPLVEELLNYLQLQVPVYVPIWSILRNSHTVNENFSDTLLNGSININRLASMGFMATKVSIVFCNRTKLAKFLSPPTSLASEAFIADASHHLCKDGGLPMAKRFLEAVDDAKVMDLLTSLRMPNLLSWKSLMSVGRHIGTLGAALTEIKGTLGDLDIQDMMTNVTLRRVVETVVPLLYADSLAALAHGLDLVREILSPIIYGGYFEEDLEKMARGLHEICGFMDEHLHNDTVEMREIVADLQNMTKFLSGMGVTRKTVDTMTHLTLNVSMLLFDQKLIKLEDLFCETSISTPALGLAFQYDILSSIYNDLCTPDYSVASRVIDYIFKNVNFFGLLKRGMRLVINEIAEKVQVNSEDANRAILALMDAQELIPILMNVLNDLKSEGNLLGMLKTLDPNKLAQGEISSQLISATGDMVCGQPIRSFDEYFRLLQSASEKPPEAKDREELRNLPTPFCQTLYQQIAYRPAGSVIWGFVKPLLKGKILFAPNSVAVHRIINEANRTFDSLAQGIAMLQRWTKGFALMGDFADHQLTVMEDVLTLPLVKSVVVGLLGQAVANMMQNLSSTLEAMGNPQRFLGAASALGDGLGCFETNRFIGYNTEEELESAARMYQKQGILMAGIVFMNLGENSRLARDAEEDNGRNSSGLPPHVKYKIRMDIDAVPTTKRIKARFWRAGPEDNFIEHLRYLRGFVEMQDMIDQAIIRTQVGQDVVMPGILMQQFPNQCQWNDDFGYLLRSNIPAVTTLAWIFIIAFFVRELVLDREMLLEQIMHVMGLKLWVNWLSWFISCFVVMLVTNVIGVLILKYGGIFPNSDLLVLFIFFFVFAISSIMFCFLMSIWFSTATVAAITAVLMYLIFYAPFVIVMTLESQLTFLPRILMNLLMSTSFCQGCLYITRFEEQNQGIQWSNIWESPVPRDEMNFAWTCIMMVVDAVLYFVLAVYFGAVISVFRHSENKLWNIIFWPVLKKNDIHQRNKLQLLQEREGSQDTLKNSSMLIDETKINNDELKVGISLQNLRKVYNEGASSEKVAVEGLSLDFYEGQITTLLGQNGAGKTTTIKLLTGQFPPMSGCATIYNKDVVYEFDAIRKNLGMCPQYNVLFDLLTVREHLEFYGRLKGTLTTKHLVDDVDCILNAMGLAQRQHELAQNLSGGMKRRLCVAVAFVGGSQTIILDEPTSGVDPVARRHIWNLIVRYKQGRTILLTTHNLDEADILSDRVAVIHEGRLLCCGSPLELKRGFGSGYHLMISKNGSDGGSDTDSGAISTSSGSDSQTVCNAASIYTFIRSYVPNVQLLEDQGTEMVFCLPYCSDDNIPNTLDTFFLDLEKHQTRLGIGSYGLSCTTLEEVFMNVCMQADAGLPITSQGHKILMLAKKVRLVDEGLISKQSVGCEPTTDPLLFSATKVVRCQEAQVGTDAWLTKTLYHVHYSHLTSVALKWSQFKWLLLKRFHHFRRDWRGLITCIILPCVFVAVAMSLTLIRPPVDPFSPSLLLNPSLYGPDSNSFFAVDPGSGSACLKFAETLVQPPGIGTTCLQAGPSLCHYSKDRQLPESVTVQKEDCRCDVAGDRSCHVGNAIFHLTRRVTNSTDILYNVTQVNVVRWLTLTQVDFIERRYGGWTFGARPVPPLLPRPDENVIAWFENKGYHALPSYINSISNAFLRGTAELHGTANDTSQYGISTYNHPLHLSKTQLGMDSLLHHVADVGIALVFLISFSFIPAGFIIYLVKERVQEEKRLQYVGGVGPLLYWTAALFADLIVLCIPVCLSAVIIAIFDLPIYMYGHNFIATLTMLFMYGWATTPLMYVAEKFFKEPSLASMILFCINVFIGINTTLCTLLMFLFQRNEMMGAAMRFLQYFFLIFPQYAFAGGLVDLTKNYVQAEIFIRFGDDTYVNPFSMEILGLNLIALAVQGVAFFFVNLMFEFMPEVLIWIERRRNQFPKEMLTEDGDVQQERNRVLNGETEGDLMRMANLYKVYNGVVGKTVAVDRVCLSIPHGECFGLLGINGAGKTTIFRMLTGELKPTYGQVFFRNKSIDTAISHGSQNIGYCPQMNALDELLTGEELLSVYAGLRGIPDEDIPLAVYKAVVQFNLQSHARSVTHTYSCGTKRKLCAAIAVMGNPDIILMDEPTSGMDPSTRRLVWHNVRQITKDRRSVILTSHSMEECDTLCHRLAIMVNGRFRCLGSPQYLKHKFGDGYTITLRIHDRPKDWNAIYGYIHDYFSGSVIKAQHCNTIEFLVSKNNSSLGDIFSQLEIDKGSLGIVDFSVTQTTLDQVFVNFVREQSEGGEPDELDEFAGRTNPGLVTDDEEGLHIHRIHANGRTVQPSEEGWPPTDTYALESDYQVTQF